ncbi:hypothetical protein [Roseovarius nitratireducens]|uniref:hypothetical protein n=1 Tax=Roseovarius nitratireducens TaxID=2044597 RepID=UPI00101AE9E6|nr:hypothetical protein [Roseovarius nitratireducens]
MATQEDRRDDFLQSLSHLRSIAAKLGGMLGPQGALTFPDHHKLSEGLFLSAWTQWEEFIRLLLIDDLAMEPSGFVQKDVTKFRVKGAPRRMAERILFHPDHPQRFVEWDFGQVRSRADTFLPLGHRFAAPLPRQGDLDKLKRVRNAIAHKSDRARESFLSLVSNAPFNLQPNQRRGLTVGRFLTSHQWNGHSVLHESLRIHHAHAMHLVA